MFQAVSNLLFHHNVESNELPNDFVGVPYFVWLLQFGDRVSKPSVKCLMMQTNRNEQKENRTVAKKVACGYSNAK